MRTIELETWDAVGEDPGVTMVDWKEGGQPMLEAFDDLLAAHGLEVVVFDNGDDNFIWKIERRV